MNPLTVECDARFESDGRGGRKALVTAPACEGSAEPGRVPRVARLMALALRFEGLLRDGTVASQAELADLGRVTRARISQILNLLHLAPDIQDALLHLPRTERGRDPLHLRLLQPIAATLDWHVQRRMWRQLTG